MALRQFAVLDSCGYKTSLWTRKTSTWHAWAPVEPLKLTENTTYFWPHIPPKPSKNKKFSTMGPRYDTPTKAQVQGAYEFLQIKELLYDSREIFDTFGVNYRAECRMTEPEAPSRQKSSSGLNKTSRSKE